MRCTIESEELCELERYNHWRTRVLGMIQWIVRDKDTNDSEKVKKIRDIFDGNVQV